MATTQTFSDGSSIVTYDDGSTLITDAEGNVSSTPSSLSTKPEVDRGWTEPESPATVDHPPVYPYNNIQQTESGHSFEMDDTPTRERVRLQHRSGTFIEMHPNGDEVHKVYGDGYEITVKNRNVLIKGHCNITIEGDSILHVKGDKTELVDGDYNLVVKGTLVQSSGKKTYMTSDDDMTIGAKPETLGTLNFGVGSHLQISGDLNVSGEITADKIFAETRVDTGALGGIKAGILGFVSSGGLSIGLPGLVAIPGTVLCGTVLSTLPIGAVAGTVVAGVNVTSPFATFGLMEAILMSDIVNSSIFNYHLHPAPRGITGPPFTSFL